MSSIDPEHTTQNAKSELDLCFSHVIILFSVWTGLTYSWLIGLDKSGKQINIFLISYETYVVGTH